MAHTKADHPLSARIMHFVHLSCMILLAISGFYIHKPGVIKGSMILWRTIHFYAMWIVTLNLVARFYWSLFGAPRDIREFLPVKENRGKLVKLIPYYLFLNREHPVTGKFNTLQKGTYNFWFFLLIVQAITGFALYWHQWPLFAKLNLMVGGLAEMHLVHYAIMWVFIWTTMIHVYLSFAEDFKAVLLMFFGIETKGAH
jgi:Ni/Fe-hydrogenase 1 B-type cytochrome subunit